MQYINAPNIILGIMNPLDNTNNQVILILKYYVYKCRCLGDKPSIHGGLKYLKYCIKQKRQPYISYPLDKKNIYVKSGCHLKLSSKWRSELETDIYFENGFSNISKITYDYKLQNFQYKLLHRILPTNTFVVKIGIKDSDLCSFCKIATDSILHYIWQCL